jgi:hypothetical protein
MKVVVAGWVAGFPVSSYFWHSVSFALGFRALGHDVWFLDDGGDEPWGWDPQTLTADPSCSAGVRFLESEMDAVGLSDRWCFRHVPEGRWYGMGEADTRQVLRDADLFVSVSMLCPMRPEYCSIPHRAGIDTDPVFTQIRIAREGLADRISEDYTRLFTFGRPPLPAQRHEWVPTRQPVVTEAWPTAAGVDGDAPFTTVTSWQAYGPTEWDGVEYAAKNRTLNDFLDLPCRTDVPIEVALGGGENHWEGSEVLGANGWTVIDPGAFSYSTAAFRDWLAASAGELGFAKHGYVTARSGWFSERTCCYLASGRPAVVQDTGWTDWLPTGDGLLPFTTMDEAVAGLEEARGNLPRHAAGARRIVEEHFEAGAVCADLLEAL